MSSDQNNKNLQASNDEGPYCFGGLKEYNLEQIESEVLSESVYLDVFAGSDLRLKSNIREISTTLNSIKKLDAISYRWNSAINNHLTDHSKGEQVGLVAQQVAEVFPELVRKDESTGFLAVNYSRLTSHLLVAIKELSEQMELQNKKIAALEEQMITIRRQQ